MLHALQWSRLDLKFCTSFSYEDINTDVASNENQDRYSARLLFTWANKLSLSQSNDMKRWSKLARRKRYKRVRDGITRAQLPCGSRKATKNMFTTNNCTGHFTQLRHCAHKAHYDTQIPEGSRHCLFERASWFEATLLSVCLYHELMRTILVNKKWAT